MRKWTAIALIAFVSLFVWHRIWLAGMQPHVKRIEETIAHYNQLYKSSTYRATIKAAEVRAAGFPFLKKVIIDQPNLAMVQGGITYAVETECIQLIFEDAKQGRYRAEIINDINALYAEAGKAPEAYVVKVSNMPSLWARVQDTSPRCVGEHCAAKPEKLLAELGFELKGDVLLTATLADRSERIGFNAAAIPKPIFMPIPSDVSRPLSLFVGMLREALVFKDARL